jgi:hypothetical protein
MSVEPKSDVTTRAEIASLDRIKTSPWLQDHLKPPAGDSVPARAKCCANFIFQRTVRDYCAINPSLFQTSVSFQTQGLRKTHPMMHMSLYCRFPAHSDRKTRCGQNRSRGGPRRRGVVKPLTRRGQWLSFPPDDYGSLGTFAKFILLTTCWAETRLSPGSNFACRN